VATRPRILLVSILVLSYESNRSDWEITCFNIFVIIYGNSRNRKNIGNKYIRDITVRVVGGEVGSVIVEIAG